MFIVAIHGVSEAELGFSELCVGFVPWASFHGKRLRCEVERNGVVGGGGVLVEEEGSGVDGVEGEVVEFVGHC